MTDHSGATFVWVTDPPSKEIIAYVREYLSKDEALKDLDEPKELMFTHIPLDKEQGFDGPAVVLTGNEEFNGFNASYHPEGFKELTFKLEDFPDLEEQMEEAGERMRQMKEDDDGKN